MTMEIPMARPAVNVKKQVHEAIDLLPDDVSLEEAAERMETWFDIVAGEADIDAGRFETNDEVRQRYGLKP